MADNDIYDNQGKYDKLVNNLDKLLLTPEEEGNRKRKYWVKNKANLKYFKVLFDKFEARDNSYIRRLRLCRAFLMICHVLDMDLKEADREDIDEVMRFSHKVNKSVKTKQDFVIDIKFLWKQLFPEKDERGHIDENITPYPVRHLSGKIDKSKEKLRGDKFSFAEFEKLVAGFSNNPCMQCFLTTTNESLGRPQEMLGRKLKDVEMHENYAKIYISEHGKEGTGFLRIIDSYFYLQKWINAHPLKHDPEAYLFINLGRVNQYQQMKPYAANKLIREKCKKLGINKPITNYSLKRNGVTMMRLQGKSDLDIQHTARWTSTKQLSTYDLSNQEESFKVELIKRGLLKGEGKLKEFEPTSKECYFCKHKNGIAETSCSNCGRPIDKEKIEQDLTQKEEVTDFMNKFTETLMTNKDASMLDIIKAMQEKLKPKS